MLVKIKAVRRKAIYWITIFGAGRGGGVSTGSTTVMANNNYRTGIRQENTLRGTKVSTALGVIRRQRKAVIRCMVTERQEVGFMWE